MNNMLAAVNNFKKCTNMRCKNEEDQFKKNKYSIEIEKLKQDLKDGKIDLIKFNSKVMKLQIIIIEGKYRDDLIDCRLKKCYNEISKTLKLSIENILTKTEKNSEDYKIASKYKKIFEKNKITRENINNLDMDIYKLKLNKLKKKKKSIFSNLIPDNMKNELKNLFDAAIAIENCLKTKCKNEQKQLKENKISMEIEKLMFNFQENLKNGNIDYKKFNNFIIKLKIKAIKEKENEELVKCQLKNCYNESLQAIKLSLENILALSEKNSKKYKFALKYKKIFEKNKLTAEQFNKFGVEMINLQNT
jgi:hypothetical protein